MLVASNPRELARALGERSISAWARRHGFLPTTAARTLHRWGRRTDRRPHGGIARAIIAQLTADLARAGRGSAA